MSNVSNDQIFETLMGISRDIGGLKSSTDLMLQGLKNHAERLAVVETAQNTLAGETKAKVRMWGVIATAVSAVVGGIVGNFRPH